MLAISKKAAEKGVENCFQGCRPDKIALHITNSFFSSKGWENLLILLVCPLLMLITAIRRIAPPQIILERELSMTHCCFPLNVLLQKNKRLWWVCAKATGAPSRKKKKTSGWNVCYGVPSNKLSPLVDCCVLSWKLDICSVCPSPFVDN